MPRIESNNNNNGTTLWMKILIGLGGAGLLGTGGVMMISTDDAKQMVEIGIMQDDQLELKDAVQKNSEGLKIVEGIVIRIESRQTALADADDDIKDSLRRIGDKIDEIPKGS